MKSNSIFGLVCMTLSILLLLLDVCSIMVAWLKAKKIEMIWQEILNEKVLSGKKTVESKSKLSRLQKKLDSEPSLKGWLFLIEDLSAELTGIWT